MKNGFSSQKIKSKTRICDLITELRNTHDHYKHLQTFFPDLKKADFKKLDDDFLSALTKYDLAEVQSRYRPSTDDTRKKSKTVRNAIETVLKCDPNVHKKLKNKHDVEDILAKMVMDKYDMYWDEYAGLWEGTRELLGALANCLEKIQKAKFPRKKPTEAKRELCLDLAKLLNKYSDHKITGYNTGTLYMFVQGTIEFLNKPRADWDRIVKAAAKSMKEPKKI